MYATQSVTWSYIVANFDGLTGRRIVYDQSIALKIEHRRQVVSIVGSTKLTEGHERILHAAAEVLGVHGGQAAVVYGYWISRLCEFPK